MDPTAAEAARRRTFAVISHPDAGKSTLTEAFALHAAMIAEAGAIHGKAGRRGTVSDWMEIERDRGISITSAALQFTYGDTVINLVDTPGHADFSEDTYRVLAAVDAAVMLLDAAKVNFVPQVLIGPVAETIARIALEQNCDGIVMGTRGLGAVAGALLGSVMTGVVGAGVAGWRRPRECAGSHA